MSPAALDRLLAILVIATAATGLATLRAGSPGLGWVFIAHDLAAGALAVAVVLKVRRSLPRAIAGRAAGRRLALGLLLALVATAAVAGGWLWVAAGGIVTVGSFTLLTLHAWAGAILGPVLVVHLMPKRWRLLRAGPNFARSAGRVLSRRSLLAGLALAAVSTGLVLSAAAIDSVRGGRRRFTGSRWLPSGGIPPATTFFGEPPPTLDVATWTLRVGARRFGLDELRTLGAVERSAVLDCTSGWAVETDWEGVPLVTVLAAAGLGTDEGSIAVRSATGWSTVLPAAEARGCLLAWAVAGLPLPAALGAPLRLVAPERRGLDWVKWVVEVDRA